MTDQTPQEPAAGDTPAQPEPAAEAPIVSPEEHTDAAPSAFPTPQAPNYAAPPVQHAPNYAAAPQFPPVPPQQPTAQQPAPQYTVPQQPAPPYTVPQQFPTSQQYSAPQQPGASQYSYAPAPNVQGAPGAPAGMPAATVPPAQQPTNTLAILSLILSFIVAPAGIITGHIALGKIKRTGEPGRGLALAGTIVGYVLTGLAVIGTVLMIMFTMILGGVAYTAAGSGIQQLEEFDEYGQYDYGSETERYSGELLDTPEKVLAVWPGCELAIELNENDGDAFYSDDEWLAAHEALASLMDPSAESDAIRAYIDYLMSNGEFDYQLTSDYIDALAVSTGKLCTQ